MKKWWATKWLSSISFLLNLSQSNHGWQMSTPPQYMEFDSPWTTGHHCCNPLGWNHNLKWKQCKSAWSSVTATETKKGKWWFLDPHGAISDSRNLAQGTPVGTDSKGTTFLCLTQVVLVLQSAECVLSIYSCVRWWPAYTQSKHVCCTIPKFAFTLEKSSLENPRCLRGRTSNSLVRSSVCERKQVPRMSWRIHVCFTAVESLSTWTVD